jgi:hypothetical protein
MNTQAHHEPSQCDEILAHLESGKPITPMEALRLYGVARLGARIWDLGRQGHSIRRELVTVRKHNGKTARVASYTLHP